MYNILYLGNSLHIMNQLQFIRNINIVAAVFESGKENENQLRSIPSTIKTIPAKNKREIEDVIMQYCDTIDFAIMYDFGIILSEQVVSRIPVFNYHPGALKTNRGSSPINWSILLADKETIMSLYRVSAEIDLGELVSEHPCRIYDHDVPDSLRARMEGEIPSMMLELVKCFEKKVYKGTVSNGIYRKRLNEIDYTILETDSEEMIKAKIRSQYSYRGAVIYSDCKKIYVQTYDQYLKIKQNELRCSKGNGLSDENLLL